MEVHRRMKNLTEYLYPTNVKNALSLYTKDIRCAYIAGGTFVIGDKNNTQRLIDITKLGLNKIKEREAEIEIGATITISDLFYSSIVEKIGNGVLTKACKLIADTPLRNMITIGGNIARLIPWAGLPTVLLTLNASIEIINKKGEDYILTADKYFANGGVNKGELITKVIVPKSSDWTHFYEKFALTTVDYTWLTMAFSVKVVDEIIEDARLAVSRITKVMRINSVEKELIGQHVSKLKIDELISALRSSINIVADYRVSKEYRKHLLGVMFKRMLQKLQEETQ